MSKSAFSTVAIIAPVASRFRFGKKSARRRDYPVWLSEASPPLRRKVVKFDHFIYSVSLFQNWLSTHVYEIEKPKRVDFERFKTHSVHRRASHSLRLTSPGSFIPLQYTHLLIWACISAVGA